MANLESNFQFVYSERTILDQENELRACVTLYMVELGGATSSLYMRRTVKLFLYNFRGYQLVKEFNI